MVGTAVGVGGETTGALGVGSTVGVFVVSAVWGTAEFAGCVGAEVCVPALGCGGVDVHAIASIDAATITDRISGTRRRTAEV